MKKVLFVTQYIKMDTENVVPDVSSSFILFLIKLQILQRYLISFFSVKLCTITKSYCNGLITLVFTLYSLTFLYDSML